MTKLKLSVLIPTLGRKEELINTIQALMLQSRHPDEIIVVDQNEPSIPEIDQLLASISIIKHIRNQTPGVAINYNRCLEHATGDIVLFLDDDIIPDPDLIAKHLENYDQETLNPSPFKKPLGGVAGRVSQPSGDLDPSRIRKIGKFHRWSGRITACFNGTTKTDVDIAPGGNMSFYRDILIKSGGFDLAFDGNGYFFETDASLRVVEGGYRIHFEPRAYVKHLMAPRGGARITNKAVHTYYFVKNGIRLGRRHSPLLGQPWIAARFIFYVIAKALYNRDQRIMTQGLKGLTQGWTQSLRILK